MVGQWNPSKAGKSAVLQSSNQTVSYPSSGGTFAVAGSTTVSSGAYFWRVKVDITSSNSKLGVCRPGSIKSWDGSFYDKARGDQSAYWFCTRSGGTSGFIMSMNKSVTFDKKANRGSDVYVVIDLNAKKLRFMCDGQWVCKAFDIPSGSYSLMANLYSTGERITIVDEGRCASLQAFSPGSTSSSSSGLAASSGSGGTGWHTSWKGKSAQVTGTKVEFPKVGGTFGIAGQKQVSSGAYYWKVKVGMSSTNSKLGVCRAHKIGDWNGSFYDTSRNDQSAYWFPTRKGATAGFIMSNSKSVSFSDKAVSGDVVYVVIDMGTQELRFMCHDKWACPPLKIGPGSFTLMANLYSAGESMQILDEGPCSSLASFAPSGGAAPTSSVSHPVSASVPSSGSGTWHSTRKGSSAQVTGNTVTMPSSGGKTFAIAGQKQVSSGAYYWKVKVGVSNSNSKLGVCRAGNISNWDGSFYDTPRGNESAYWFPTRKGGTAGFIMGMNSSKSASFDDKASKGDDVYVVIDLNTLQLRFSCRGKWVCKPLSISGGTYSLMANLYSAGESMQILGGGPCSSLASFDPSGGAAPISSVSASVPSVSSTFTTGGADTGGSGWHASRKGKSIEVTGGLVKIGSAGGTSAVAGAKQVSSGAYYWKVRVGMTSTNSKLGVCRPANISNWNGSFYELARGKQCAYWFPSRKGGTAGFIMSMSKPVSFDDRASKGDDVYVVIDTKTQNLRFMCRGKWVCSPFSIGSGPFSLMANLYEKGEGMLILEEGPCASLATFAPGAPSTSVTPVAATPVVSKPVETKAQVVPPKPVSTPSPAAAAAAPARVSRGPPPKPKPKAGFSVIGPPRYTDACSPCKLVEIDEEEDEFWEVEEKFKATLNNHIEDYTSELTKVGKAPITFRLLQVQKVVNPELTRRFKECRAALKELGLSKHELRRRVGYHGTRLPNIKKICTNGLLRVGHPLNPSKAVDAGWFGDSTQGIYVSRYADYTLKYANQLDPLDYGEKAKIIMFDCLPGKVKHIPQATPKCAPSPGFHSHSSSNHQEWFLFSEQQCVPTYVLKIKAIEDRRTTGDDS